MAIRYAVANGNWSATGTWDGGTLPGNTDDVYANNFTVTIDQSITVNSLKKISNGSPAIAAGGSFSITAAVTVTITAGIVAADNVTNTSYLLQVNAGASAVSIVAAGGITGGAASARVAVQINTAYTGTLTINGNLTGGGAGSAYALNIPASTACTVAITGTITGNSSTSTGYAVGVSGSAVTFSVTGTIIGGASAPGIAVLSGGSLTCSVTGSITGGSASTAHGLSVLSGGAASITASTLGGSGGASGVNVASGGAATIRGTGTASATSAAITSASACRISGDLYHSSGSFAPVAGTWSVIASEEVRMHLSDDSAYPASNAGSAVVLSLLGSDLPDPEDVRAATTYGPSGGSTGTLAVPPPASVAAGVPTDDTVGSAVLSLSDLAAVTGAQIAAAHG